MPAKIFDAMAMAKPIIATHISDLPEILDGCGWIVEPDNHEHLAATIQTVLEDSKKAEQVGQKARKKCIENYSFDAMEKELSTILQKWI